MNSRSFLIFALVVLAVFHSGETLKCYQCSSYSGSDESCEKKLQHEHEHYCGPYDITDILPFCIACNVHFYNGTSFIHRHCANQLIYKKLSQCVAHQVDFMECKTCNKDLCNGTSTNVLTFAWLGLLWMIRSIFAGAY